MFSESDTAGSLAGTQISISIQMLGFGDCWEGILSISGSSYLSLCPNVSWKWLLHPLRSVKLCQVGSGGANGPGWKMGGEVIAFRDLMCPSLGG